MDSPGAKKWCSEMMEAVGIWVTRDLFSGLTARSSRFITLTIRRIVNATSPRPSGIREPAVSPLDGARHRMEFANEEVRQSIHFHSGDRVGGPHGFDFSRRRR